MKSNMRESEIVEILNQLPRFQVSESAQDKMLQDIRTSKGSYRKEKKRFSLPRTIGVGFASILILGAASMSVASARDELGNIIARFRHASHSGILVTISFQGADPYAPYGPESVSGVAKSATSIAQLHDLFPTFPKLSLPGWTAMQPQGMQFDGSHEWVYFTTKSGVSVNAYHDLTRTMVIDGMTTESPTADTTVLDGTEAKIFTFHAGTGGISYIVWKRGEWTIVLTTMNSDKDASLKVARTFDQEFVKGLNQ